MHWQNNKIKHNLCCLDLTIDDEGSLYTCLTSGQCLGFHVVYDFFNILSIACNVLGLPYTESIIMDKPIVSSV